MTGPKIERLIAAGSLKPAGQRGYNIELALWLFVFAVSMLALVYWGT